MADADKRLTTEAARHHGIVSLEQARAAGLTERQIHYRLATGRWERVARGVFRLAGTPPSWRQDALAACLAGPEGCRASHLTAAALHGVLPEAPPRPHITGDFTRSSRQSFAVVHRARHGVSDFVVIDSVPTTTLTRTVIDCAGILGPLRTQRLADAAFHRGNLTVPQVGHGWDDVRTRPGRAGEPRLRDAIEPWSTAIRPGSPAELRLRRQVREWGYPEPELQVVVRGRDGEVIGRVDVGWPDRMVGIEYDSEEFHAPPTWASDEQRHTAIEDVGWRLLHADKADLRPGASRLRHALERAWARSTAA